MTNTIPLITVITVVYNGAATIEETIRNVLNLSYPNLKYIVIDGASTDGTADIIKKYASGLACFISEPDKGIYDAMNKGWAKADNDSYIIYVGSGDKINTLPDINNIIKFDIIYGDVLCGNYTFNASADFRLKLINGVHHQAELIKKSIHQSPPFSLAFPLFADFDFNQRLYKAGYKFYKDQKFHSYAMAGGVSSKANTNEMLNIVNKNLGKKYFLLAKVYYSFQNLKALFFKNKSLVTYLKSK